MLVIDIFTAVLVTVGVLFFCAGSIGLLRFPNVFCRLHALTKADNLGLGIIVLGLMPQFGSLVDSVQLLIIWLVVMFSGAVCTFLVANFILKDEAMDNPLRQSVTVKKLSE